MARLDIFVVLSDSIPAGIDFNQNNLKELKLLWAF